MKIVGLTGGIGSGKTTVAKMFSELGVPIYIADVEAKKLTNSSKFIRKNLIELLGEKAYENNILNRPYVADKIFNDKDLLKSVNNIIHPKVSEHFEKWVSKQKTGYVIKEAAILFENDGYKKCDFVILVTAPKSVRLKRVMERDKSSETEIQQRMDNQWSDETKAKLANIVIENIELEKTKKKVVEVHNYILHNLR